MATAVGGLQACPSLRLGVLDPGDQVLEEQGAGAIVAIRSTGFVEPAMGGEVIADAVFEGDLLVEAHAAAPELLGAQ